MVTTECLLRVSLLALLILKIHGFPVKGSKSKHQSSGSSSNAGGNVASHQGTGGGHPRPVSYTASGGVSKPMQAPSHPQFVQTVPVPVALSSMPDAGYTASSGLFLPVQAGYVGGVAMPLQAGYVAGSQQPGAARPNLPETQWSIPPKAFEEESTNTQPQDSSMVVPPFPPAPPAPTLQSGETSNVVKEAELGNYHQQTEEFGYPAMGPGQGFPPVVLTSPGVGGLWGYPSPYPLPYPFPYPYPDFDYRLLYGLYPPGTYTTFSKEHEKGKDYYQTTHYLKEHGSGGPGTPQNPGSGQQKVFPAAP